MIREIGTDLAQTRVDIAFLRARLEAVREAVAAIESLQMALLSSPTYETAEVPVGMMLVPAETLTVLKGLLS